MPSSHQMRESTWLSTAASGRWRLRRCRHGYVKPYRRSGGRSGPRLSLRSCACKSADGVPYRPWPGPTASAGLLISAEIRTRWCQLWVSSTGWRFANPASSSRSQVAMQTARAAARLTWEAPSVGVRWRSLPSVVIVTHLVTRVACDSVPRVAAFNFRRSSGASLRPVMLQLSDQTDLSVDDQLALPYSTDWARNGHVVSMYK